MMEHLSTQDVTVTSDIKLDSKWVANTKFDFASKKYTVGATWNGKVAGKASTVKASYSDRDGLFNGDATVAVLKSAKANVTFNNKQVRVMMTLA